jgi:cell division septation protein DedD
MVTMPTIERECPECGSPAEASQEYCLQCGHRLPPDPVAAGVPRRALASGGPAWTLLVTGVIALLAAAVVAAVQLTTDEAEPLLVATSPQPTVIPTTEPPEPTATVPTTTAPEPTTPPPTQPPPRADRVIEWPAGTDGWTLVLASIPEGAGNRAVATRQARQALDRGLRQVGVLVSSRYSSLHPGYLVVFSGVYSNRSAAEQALSRARVAGYRSAYTRQITP